MERRSGMDRRQQQVEVTVERRECTERRSGLDRREHKIEFAIDRRTYL